MRDKIYMAKKKAPKGAFYSGKEKIYMEIVLCVALSVLASMLATKIQTVKYFDVVDDYVKGLMNDVKNSIFDKIENNTPANNITDKAVSAVNHALPSKSH